MSKDSRELEVRSWKWFKSKEVEVDTPIGTLALVLTSHPIPTILDDDWKELQEHLQVGVQAQALQEMKEQSCP